MQELEEQAVREESKSHHDFLSACQAILHHAPQSLKENLTTSYHIFLGCNHLHASSSALTCQNIPSRGTDICGCLSQASTQMVPTAKKVASFTRAAWESTSIDETSPQAMHKGPTSSKRQEAPIWFASLKPSHAEAFN